MTRWTTLLMDDARLRALPGPPAGGPTDDTAGPAPLELYRRWERQQWSAEALDLSGDHQAFADERHPAAMRDMLRSAVTTFIIGEYTGLDMLGPILTGSPAEEYTLFLGTQTADETRHTRAMFRMGTEVLGLSADPRTMLAQAWRLATPAHHELALLEGESARDVRAQPMDYGRWLRAVVLFHLITEGVLALVGQRVLVHALREVRAFEGIRTAFVAMGRDESRHVGFGLHALRRGIQEGHAEVIYGALEDATPLALRLDNEFDGISVDFRQMSVEILRRHLGRIGASPVFVSHLLDHYTPRITPRTDREQE